MAPVPQFTSPLIPSWPYAGIILRPYIDPVALTVGNDVNLHTIVVVVIVLRIVVISYIIVSPMARVLLMRM